MMMDSTKHIEVVSTQPSIHGTRTLRTSACPAFVLSDLDRASKIIDYLIAKAEAGPAIYMLCIDFILRIMIEWNSVSSCVLYSYGDSSLYYYTEHIFMIVYDK